MKTQTFNFGDTVRASIFGKQVAGMVTGTGEHKGRLVIDIITEDGSERFLYLNQITEHNGESIN